MPTPANEAILSSGMPFQPLGLVLKDASECAAGMEMETAIGVLGYLRILVLDSAPKLLKVNANGHALL
ncbi:MAG TPA: hypothetical protein VK457_14850 [Chloroflexota bacterium]|nr:hypothetical protein [Chloroflexota bacterium]